MTTAKMMRAKDAAAFLGIAESTFWRWVREGRIAKGINLTPRTTVWRADDIEAFISTMEGESRGVATGEARA